MIRNIKLNYHNYFISILIFLYICFYTLGPAAINIYVTLLSLISFFYIFTKKNFFKCVRGLDDFLIIFFFLFITFSSFLNKNLDLEILSFLRFICIYLAISLISEKFTKNNYTNFKLFYFFIFIISIDTIVQYFLGYNLLGYQKYDHIRLTGIFEDEPIIGSFLMKLVIPIIWIFLVTKKLSLRLFFLISVMILGITLSGERMPLLQLIFGLFLIFASLILFNKKKIIYFLIIFPILIISIAYSNTAKERFKSTFDSLESLKDSLVSNKVIDNSSSVNDYFMNFYSAYYLWNNNKIIGGGYRYYNSNCSDDFIEGKENYCSTHPHNIYLEILSDYGLVGLFIFISFLITLFAKYFKSKYYYENLGILIVFVVISVPFVTSQSIFSSYYGSIYFLIIFILKYLIIFKKKFN